jgi:fibro-slime domain-containing protein
MKFGYVGRRWPVKLLVAAGVVAGTLAMSAPASADTFSVQYFQVTTGSDTAHSDFFPGGVPTGTVSNDYVGTIGSATLNGSGMPAYNSGESGAAAANDVIGGQLMWWTPGAYGQNTIASTGSAPLTVGTTAVDMFPPNSTGGTNVGNTCIAPLSGNCEETAELTGYFDLTSPQSVTFSVSADDDAFVYVDGVLVEDLGGIHPVESGPSYTDPLGAGSHKIQIFYADQDQVAASLAFDDGGINVTSSPTPEPGSLALLGTGVLGLAGVVRRRFQR